MAASLEIVRSAPVYYEQDWTSSKLALLSEDPGIVASCDIHYVKIDSRQTMEDLIMCGEMLQLALTAAGDKDCSAPILHILSQYHSLTNKSRSATGAFVNASLEALRMHKIAAKCFKASNDSKTPEDQKQRQRALGLKKIESCKEFAGAMATIAGELEEATHVLELEAEKAMLMAKDERIGCDKKKAELAASMDKLKADKARMQENVKQAMERAKKEEDEFAAAERDNTALEEEIRNDYNSCMGKIEVDRAALEKELSEAFQTKSSSLSKCFTTAGTGQGEAETKRRAVLAKEQQVAKKENELARLQDQYVADKNGLAYAQYVPAADKEDGETGNESSKQEKQGLGAVAGGAVAMAAGGPIGVIAGIACAAAGAGRMMSANAVKKNEAAKKVQEEQKRRNTWMAGQKTKGDAIENTYQAAKKVLSDEIEKLNGEASSLKIDADSAVTSMTNVKQDELRIIEGKFEEVKTKVNQKLAELHDQRQAHLQRLAQRDARASDRTKKNLERKDKAKELARQATEQQHEENALLQECLVSLANDQKNGDTLEKTLSCLAIVLKTMGKVKTTFGDVKMFWECVAAHSASLQTYGKEIEEYVECEMFDEVFDQIAYSAQGWACLGYVNQNAHHSIVEANDKVKGFMQALPANESLEKTMELVQNLQSKLEAEDAKIQEDMQLLDFIDNSQEFEGELSSGAVAGA